MQTQIDEALDALKEDLLPAMNEHALLEAFHEAAREIGDKPNVAYSLEKLAYAEMKKTNERLDTLEAEIKQLKENHETTIHRLRVLWAMQDAMKPPP